MLRITTETDGKHTVLRVEGKLVAPWVVELEEAWRRLSVDSRQPLIVDVRSLTFAGGDAKDLLARMYSSGAELLTSGTLMNALVAQWKKDRDERAKGKS